MNASGDTAPGGWLSELFCSLQGEGLYAGERQVFIRTAGCGLECVWCDTAFSKRRTEWCVVYGPDETRIPNPVSVPRAAEAAADLAASFGPVSSASITGGEPLEQSAFVSSLAASLRQRGFRVHLDTNGVDAAGFEAVSGHIDVVAMDIKLPSATGRAYWSEHRAFLAAAAGKELFVKVVIDMNTRDDEFLMAVETIADVDDTIPLVLQPESGVLFSSGGGARALVERVQGLQRTALKRLARVRVIPQCHRILRIR
ncbi:MAG: 7-carboxy-7-deazaguanine synthase QueE [Chitinivibrionia bacterium]|nr:7-carboxy-7-deazaguanine synthase QueE [Chitinivibrionia bacterium]